MANLLKYNFKNAVNPVFFCIIERAKRAGILYRNPFEYGYFGYDDIIGQVNVHTGKVNLVRAHHILEGRIALTKSAKILFSLNRDQFLTLAIGHAAWTDDFNPTDDPSQLLDTTSVDLTALDRIQHYPEKNIWYQELDQACKYLAGNKDPVSSLIDFKLTRGGNNCMKYGEGFIQPGNSQVADPTQLAKRFLFTLTITNLSTQEIRAVRFNNFDRTLEPAPIIGVSYQDQAVDFFQIFQKTITVNPYNITYDYPADFAGCPGTSNYGFSASMLTSEIGTKQGVPPIPPGGNAVIIFSAGIYLNPRVLLVNGLPPHKVITTPTINWNHNGLYVTSAYMNDPADPIGTDPKQVLIGNTSTAQSMDIVDDYGICSLGPGGGPPPPPPVSPPPKAVNGEVTIDVEVVDKNNAESKSTIYNPGDTGLFHIYTINTSASTISGNFSYTTSNQTGLTGSFSGNFNVSAAPGKNQIDSKSYPISTLYPIGVTTIFFGKFTYTKPNTTKPIDAQSQASFDVALKLDDPTVATGQLILPVSSPSIPQVSKPGAPPPVQFSPLVDSLKITAGSCALARGAILTMVSAVQAAVTACSQATPAVTNFANDSRNAIPDPALASTASAAQVAAFKAVKEASLKVSDANSAIIFATDNANSSFTYATTTNGVSTTLQNEISTLLDDVKALKTAVAAVSTAMGTAFVSSGAVPSTVAALKTSVANKTAAEATALIQKVNKQYTDIVAVSNAMQGPNSSSDALATEAGSTAQDVSNALSPAHEAILDQYPHELVLSYSAQNTDTTIRIHVNSILIKLQDPFEASVNGNFDVTPIDSISFDLAPSETHIVTFLCKVLSSATYNGVVTMQGSASGTGSDGKAKSALSVINPGHFTLTTAAQTFSDTIDFTFTLCQKVLDNDPGTSGGVLYRFIRPDGSLSELDQQWSIRFKISVHNNSSSIPCIVKTVTCKRENSDGSFDPTDVYALQQPVALDHTSRPETGTNVMEWDSIMYDQLVPANSGYLKGLVATSAPGIPRGNVPEGPLVIVGQNSELLYEYRIIDRPIVNNKTNKLTVTVESLFANGNTDVKTHQFSLTQVVEQRLYEPVLQGQTSKIHVRPGKYKVTIYGGMFLFLDDPDAGGHGPSFSSTAHWGCEVFARNIPAKLNMNSKSTLPSVVGYVGAKGITSSEENAIAAAVGDIGKYEFNVLPEALPNPTDFLEIDFSVSDRFAKTPLRPTAIAIEYEGPPDTSGTPANLVFSSPPAIRHFLFTRSDGTTPLPNNSSTINCEVTFNIQNTGQHAAIIQSINVASGTSLTSALVFPPGFANNMKAQYMDGLGPTNCININQGNDPNTLVAGGGSVQLVFVFPVAVTTNEDFSLTWIDVITSGTSVGPTTTVLLANQIAKSTAPQTDSSKFKYHFGLFTDAFYPGQLKAHYLGPYISSHSSGALPRAAWGASIHYNARSFFSVNPAISFGYPMYIGLPPGQVDSTSNSDREAYSNTIKPLPDSALIGYPTALNSGQAGSGQYPVMFDGDAECAIMSGDSLAPNVYNTSPGADTYAPSGFIIDGRYQSVAHAISQDKDLPAFCSMGSITTNVTGGPGAWIFTTDYYVGTIAYNKAPGVPAAPSAISGLKYMLASVGAGTITAATITSPTSSTATVSGPQAIWGDNNTAHHICGLSSNGLVAIRTSITVTQPSQPSFSCRTYIETSLNSTPYYMTSQTLSGVNSGAININRWLGAGGPASIQILPPFSVSSMITITANIRYITTSSIQMANTAIIVQKGNNTLLPAGFGCSFDGTATVRMGAFCFDTHAGFYAANGPSTNNVGIVFTPSTTFPATATFSVTAKSFGGLTLIINDPSVFKTL